MSVATSHRLLVDGRTVASDPGSILGWADDHGRAIEVVEVRGSPGTGRVVTWSPVPTAADFPRSRK